MEIILWYQAAYLGCFFALMHKSSFALIDTNSLPIRAEDYARSVTWNLDSKRSFRLFQLPYLPSGIPNFLPFGIRQFLFGRLQRLDIILSVNEPVYIIEPQPI